MGKIDTDYLWLHQQQHTGSSLRRFALLLVIPLLAGVVWLTLDLQVPDHLDNGASRPGTRAIAANAPESDASAAATGSNQNAGTATGSLLNTDPARAHGDPLESKATVPKLGDNTDTAPDDTLPGTAAAVADPQHNPARALPVSIDTQRPREQADNHRLDKSRADSRGPRSLGDGGRALALDQFGPSWHTVKIRAGDTLSIAFNRNTLSYADSLKIAHLPRFGDRFTSGLRAGDRMRVQANAEGRVLKLNYPVDALHTLQVRPAGRKFKGEMVDNELEHRKAFTSGVIDTSFYVDALQAGLTDKQIMKLVKIFGWDIDFALDIRPGDRFVVVYDELFKDGARVANGPILAASFNRGGRMVRAVRYTGAGTSNTVYYSPDGRAMKKAFIRTPVDYTRISSNFNLSRKHPILNRIRRHEGTDYAAPSGTPIRVTGNGRVAFRGRRGGYGNMIIVKHSSHLSTRYGHMSSFVKGLAVGSRVQQGEVIGYVGMTGLATGPHLHYEFRVDGRPKDPETVDLPKAAPLPKKYRPDFDKRTAPLVAQLDSLSNAQIARAADPGDGIID